MGVLETEQGQVSASRTGEFPRVQVHPGAGVVDRRGDTVLVVPALPSGVQPVRELLELCRRPDPSGDTRIEALRALLDLRPPVDMPAFALLVRTGQALRVLVHGAVQVVIDGRPADFPASRGGRLAEHVVEDGAWHTLTVTADDAAPQGTADPLDLHLESGSVPGDAVTLRPGPTRRTPTSATMLRPAVRFRNVLLGECAVRTPGGAARRRRPPLPVAGAAADGAAGRPDGPEILVEGVHCPAGHFTDPEQPTCRACGASLPPGLQRVRLPRPPLGVLVTDGGTIYPVTGDFVIGREPDEAPDVLAGRARPLPLRDAARSTSRVHAHVTVAGWRVLISDDGSANGTSVSGHGAAGPWLPVAPQAPLPLTHGDRIRLGRRQLLYDTWREAVVPQVFQ